MTTAVDQKLAAAEARIRELESRANAREAEVQAHMEARYAAEGRVATQAAEILAFMENRREADARIRSLETQVTGFDCRFAGKWAETSGSHCPAERPCDRCAAESEVRMWEGINAKLIDRAETAEAKLAEAVGDMCPSCRLRWDLSRLDEKERGE